ncbi:TPA: glycerol kinase, partial [Legionella pneumophila]|nr:glycerol kinase [Legionella pneumophila]
VNQWFLQFMADQCQLTIQKPKDIETTAKGAAVLAAIGSGLFDSVSSVNKVWDVENEFQPSREREVVEKDFRGWLEALAMVKARHA